MGHSRHPAYFRLSGQIVLQSWAGSVVPIFEPPKTHAGWVLSNSGRGRRSLAGPVELQHNGS